MKHSKTVLATALFVAVLPAVALANVELENDPWKRALTQAQPPVIHVQGKMMGQKMAMPTDGETYTLGSLSVSTPFAFETMPNSPVAGGFMTITNAGSTDDRLIGAASDAAGRIEIHEMAMEGDVMKMRELEGGLPLPAGETVALQPGGYHVMFMDLAGPLTEGDMVTVTLTFESAGDVEVVMPVMARMNRAGQGQGEGHGHGHGMSSN